MSTVRSHLDSLDPGDRGRGNLVAGQLASGRDIAIPYLLLKGARPGPCLWVNGNVHGDEINGTMTAIRLYRESDPVELCGSLVVTPTANPLAFEARDKHTPQDGLDLDQAFPGRADGMVTERLAARLLPEIASCADVVVSLHSIGWMMDSRPYAVYKQHPDASVAERDLLACIACFEPSVVCRMPVAFAQGELPGNIAGALDYQCLALGKRAFMLELGTARRLQEDVIAQALSGFSRLFGHLGMLTAPAHRKMRLRRVTRRSQKTATRAGIFRALVAPGALVGAGTPLGEIIDLAGDVVEQVRFDHDVIVIGIRAEPVIHLGDRTVFVATEWDDMELGSDHDF